MNRKRIIPLFIALFLLTGCENGNIVYSYSHICSFDWELSYRGMNVTSDRTVPKVYEIEVERILLDVKNPPERIKLAIVDEETTAVEGEDYSLSTKELVFAKGAYKTSFQLTIMPVTVAKTLTLMLDYTHPQMSVMGAYGEPRVIHEHFARFRITHGND